MTARPGPRHLLWPIVFMACLLVLIAPLRAMGEDLTGRLIVATPELGDSNFKRTVIFMVSHGMNGALGLVVNEPIGELPLTHLINSQEETNAGTGGTGSETLIAVHYGGPVEPRRPFILHSAETMLAGSVKIADEVAFSDRRETLESLADSERPRHLVLTLGYAGWAPGQLEAEIKRGSWYVAEWDEFLVFGANNAAKWESAVARYGPEL